MAKKGKKAAKAGGDGGDYSGDYEDDLYDAFPPAEELGYPPGSGYNEKRRLNDASLFTAEAQADPVIREFLDLPFDVSYLQTKSSSREAEWLFHKPHRVLAGEIKGFTINRGRFDHPGHITTLLVNHDRTMARWKQSVVLFEDETDTTMVVYKQNEA